MHEHLETVRQYHEITKHRPYHYARGPGQLDWATQPDPFRRYAGAVLHQLELLSCEDGPPYDAIWTRGVIPTTPINRHSVSRLFLDSLALSAWKRAGGAMWSLRVNPSAGNLHPIEGYLVCGAIDGLCDQPMVAHYAPKEHLLERRMTIPLALWRRLVGGLPDGTLLVGLTSISWRSSWKYGERSYRYVHLDLGHALAAVCVAAAGLGWEVCLMDHVGTSEVAQILSIADPAGAEPEEAGCLLLIAPGEMSRSECSLDLDVLAEMEFLPREGKPDQLSPSRVDWPMIEEVAEAAHKPSGLVAPLLGSRPKAALQGSMRGTLLRHVIHQRRSALNFDRTTLMQRSVFYGMLQRTLVHEDTLPLAVLPWEPLVHLVLFVHRVTELPAGLYLLNRGPVQNDRLRLALHLDFDWERPRGCPDGLELVRLLGGDMRSSAVQIACMQTNAGDGCFSLAMIADLEAALSVHGPWMYPRLHWECGLLGQILYLEAEVAGLRGCGLGCYFDDLMHELLGLKGGEFQDLYHFTVGKAVEDPRISTLPAYPGV